MSKKFLSVFILLFCVQLVFAQNPDDDYEDDEDIEAFEGLKEEKKKLDLSRFRVGGDFGLGFFGSGGFFTEISPTIGYQIVEHRIEVGPGIVYQHESLAGIYSVNNIGGQAYIRGYIWEGFFLQVDGFLVNFNYNEKVSGRKAKFTYGNGFIGGGYAFNHKTAPFYLVISVKTNMVVDSYYPTRRIVPSIGFQIRL